MRRVFAFCIAAAALCGCSGKIHQAPVESRTTADIVDRELAGSREEILRELSRLRDVTRPEPAPFQEDAHVPEELKGYPAHLAWDGPIEKGLVELARKVDWKARKYGRAPEQDVMVHCDGTDSPHEILQKFDAQAGSRARVVVDAGSRTFKLIYSERVTSGGQGGHAARRGRDGKPRAPVQAPPRERMNHKLTLPATPPQAAAQTPPPAPAPAPKIEITPQAPTAPTRQMPPLQTAPTAPQAPAAAPQAAPEPKTPKADEKRGESEVFGNSQPTRLNGPDAGKLVDDMLGGK